MKALIFLLILLAACGGHIKQGGEDGEETGPEVEDLDLSESVDPILDDAGREEGPVEEDFVVPEESDFAEDAADAEVEVEEEVVVCEPGSSWCRDDGDVETCLPDGSGTVVVDCLFGCSEDPEVHCLELIPSNADDASLICVAGTGALAVPAGVTFLVASTETGSILGYDEDLNEISPPVRGEGTGLVSGISFEVLEQDDPEAPGIGVFSFSEFHLPAGVEWLSHGPNAIAVFSCGNVAIDGIFRAGAIEIPDPSGGTIVVPGPGGNPGSLGPGAGTNGVNHYYRSGGGGGGSYGGIGGRGGYSYGGDGGPSYGTETLIPLLGGSGGGIGADNGEGYGLGGAGGGAVQISTPAEISIVGAVESGGWGGIGGDRYGNSGGGGGGGGSGGAVLLEAHTISISPGAVVAANGGGGGSGADYWTFYGDDGERGDATLEGAIGGVPPSLDACWGGDGSSALVIDGESIDCYTEENSGGGGGGAGRLRLNAAVHAISSDTTSPSLDVSPTTATLGSPTLQ